jgi:hypothetical protein
MSGKISVNVNNGRKMTLEQYKHDGGIVVTITTGKIVTDVGYTISPGDMVTLINWYRYQKAHDNPDLSF